MDNSASTPRADAWKRMLGLCRCTTRRRRAPTTSASSPKRRIAHLLKDPRSRGGEPIGELYRIRLRVDRALSLSRYRRYRYQSTLARSDKVGIPDRLISDFSSSRKSAKSGSCPTWRPFDRRFKPTLRLPMFSSCSGFRAHRSSTPLRRRRICIHGHSSAHRNAMPFNPESRHLLGSLVSQI